MLKCHLSLHDHLSLKNVWLVAEHADLQLAFVRPSNALNSATLINGKFEIVRTILRVFLYILGTGDPRFARFQFTRIHTTQFFQGLCGMGSIGSTEPPSFYKLPSNLSILQTSKEVWNFGSKSMFFQQLKICNTHDWVL